MKEENKNSITIDIILAIFMTIIIGVPLIQHTNNFIKENDKKTQKEIQKYIRKVNYIKQEFDNNKTIYCLVENNKLIRTKYSKTFFNNKEYYLKIENKLDLVFINKKTNKKYYSQFYDYNKLCKVVSSKEQLEIIKNRIKETIGLKPSF